MGLAESRPSLKCVFLYALAQQRPQVVKKNKTALDSSFLPGIFLFLIITVSSLPHLTSSKTSVIQMKQCSGSFCFKVSCP